MRDLSSLLERALQENHLLATPHSLLQWVLYLNLLQRWNRVFNLTTINEPREMVYLHIIDSLLAAPYLYGRYCLDVGTGPGLPGIPLAIAYPALHWTLLDKNSKKTRFLTQAIAELGLSNAVAVHSRSEDFHPQQCFDNILSRAFGTIRLFLETTDHLLCPNGNFIAMKGRYPQAELTDIPEGFQVHEVKKLSIHGIAVERHIIRVGRG